MRWLCASRFSIYLLSTCFTSTKVQIVTHTAVQGEGGGDNSAAIHLCR